jgi:hypothetical protein
MLEKARFIGESKIYKLKNEEEPERDNSEQNVPEGKRGR